MEIILNEKKNEIGLNFTNKNTYIHPFFLGGMFWTSFHRTQSLPSIASREDDTSFGLEVGCWEGELDEGVLWKCRPWLFSVNNMNNKKTGEKEILGNSVVLHRGYELIRIRSHDSFPSHSPYDFDM